MTIHSICISVITASLLVTSAGTSAYINEVENTAVSTDRLDELFNATPAADEIWNKLTSDFVDQYDAGNYTQAAVTANTVYNLAENVYGPNDINTADSMLKLGIINETLGDLAKAKEYMLGALVILENQLDPYHEDVAVVLTNLANVYFEEKQPAKSEFFHKRALEIRKRAFGDNDPMVAQSIYNLAVLYDEMAEYDRAMKLYKQALKIWNVSYGDNHPYVANALNNLANVYMLKDEIPTAIELHRHSLSARRKIYGDNHPEVARSLINLGSIYVKAKAYELAKPLYTEAVSLAETLFGQQHPQVAMLLYSLANIYHIQGRMQVTPHSQSNRQTPVENSDAGSLKVNFEQQSAASDKNEKAVVYYNQAVPLYERALAIFDNSIGKNHPAVSAMLNELVILYRSIGKDKKADQMLARLSEFDDVVDVHTK